MKYDLQKTAVKFRAAMDHAKIKPAELARETGIWPAYISYIRNGRQHLSPKYIQRLCRPLRVKPEAVIVPEESPND